MAPLNSGAGTQTPLFEERLRTPWWWYLVGIFVGALLAVELSLAGLSGPDWLPLAVLMPLGCAMVWSLGRTTVEVTAAEIRVRGAHLPFAFVSGVVELDARTLRRVVGREGDPAAFVAIRPWIGPGVQLWLDDPDDPSPYWVLSTRRPAELAALVRERIQ